MARVALNELNIDLKSTPEFIGVYEHFYDDSMYENNFEDSVNKLVKYLEPHIKINNTYKISKDRHHT